jgi:hypothetical protein
MGFDPRVNDFLVAGRVNEEENEQDIKMCYRT